MRHANKALGALVLALLLFSVGYVIAYGMMLDGSPDARIHEFWSGQPVYRWRSEEARTVFAPVHWADRKLRPERWRVLPSIPIFLCPSDPRPPGSVNPPLSTS
jgi:hypothetical protein